ncbi:MAG TPA: patatin-like phospholipase family protein [Gammaproteobacteria bacterium]|nr:patatin-like phospholipase family protein [Gammaproteobacteria bacterium]
MIGVTDLDALCPRAAQRDNRRQLLARPVNLALQGGGAHGAYTWGVLDRLLEDGRVEIEAISGTSAGAINAVILADGFMRDGRDGARQALADFWRDVSRRSWWSPLKRTPLDLITGNWNLDHSPGFMLFDILSRFVSPYELNPTNFNPLHEAVRARVDFERVRRCEKVKLFVSATSVFTGRVKVFQCSDLSIEAVMASACLPNMFRAVEINGEPYWDGGYMGNPVLFPFYYHCRSRDVVIVQINPLVRRETPTTAPEISNRVSEITFNASLMRELRAIDFVSRLLQDGNLDPERYRRMLIHRISDENELKPLRSSSKLNTEWPFLLHLRDIGRRSAAEWLERNFDRLGEESSVDIRSLFV